MHYCVLQEKLIPGTVFIIDYFYQDVLNRLAEIKFLASVTWLHANDGWTGGCESFSEMYSIVLPNL
jgi:hypothetical protein